MNTTTIKISFLIAMAGFLAACGGDVWTPKPRGFNHIELPPHEYQKLNPDSLPYGFEFSKHADFYSFKNEKNKQVIDYKKLGAKVWITYFPVKNSLDTLDKLIATTYKLLMKNDTRADAIGNDTIQTSGGNKAMIFFLQGEVPTQYQFFCTDSTTNFLRGALYFETAKKNDSLAPVIDYVKEDINQMLKTLEWREK